MNTLSRAITAQWFIDTTVYAALRARWRALVCSDRKHELDAAHHLLYLALCGKDWRRGFTPPRNPRKLANGALQGWALFRALRTLHSEAAEPGLLAPFGGLVTPEMLQPLRKLLPFPNPYALRPDEFTGGRFLFEAYDAPAEEEGKAHA